MTSTARQKQKNISIILLVFNFHSPPIKYGNILSTTHGGFIHSEKVELDNSFKGLILTGASPFPL